MADDQAQGGPASYRAPGGPAPDEPTRGHPVKAMLGGILVLWLFLWIIIPNPKDQPIDPTTGATKTTPGMTTANIFIPMNIRLDHGVEVTAKTPDPGPRGPDRASFSVSLELQRGGFLSEHRARQPQARSPGQLAQVDFL